MPLSTPTRLLPHRLLAAAAAVALAGSPKAQPVTGRPSLSGIYPHLAFFNDEGECGTGAVVPWAGRLWVVTYAPHKPLGSSDKLYEISPQLERKVRPESIGGTPANRMVHRESKQLFIGPYVIAADGNVRTIPYDRMYGRPTGNARHLTDPANKVYLATMEEGIYEIDVRSLEVTEVFRDEQLPGGRKAALPGYHGKGLYSGQGRLIYANNGEHGQAAKTNPATPSGVLASWPGGGQGFEIVRRNQFTEVTGPGGIHGNPNPDSDPVWSLGWDHRSVILMALDKGKWHTFRMPKASNTYDGAHGWNTEWPRIREIGGGDALLATMHGTFWSFPRTFSARNTNGIRPRSTYLKVVGDFCHWQDHVVLGCDDTASSSFLNTRKSKDHIAPPRSQSNLWFLQPGDLDQLGPASGSGALWLNESAPANHPSDPFLINGYTQISLHLSGKTTANTANAHVTVEIDPEGNGQWRQHRTVTLGQTGPIPLSNLNAPWLRLIPSANLTDFTAVLCLSNPPPPRSAARFAGLARPGDGAILGGLVRARAGSHGTLAMAAIATDGSPAGCYELDESLQLKPATDPALLQHTLDHAAIAAGTVETRGGCVQVTEDAGKRWLLPKGNPCFDSPASFGPARAIREVVTERDLVNLHGTFYELPAENAGGFAKIRPISTHNRLIHDFCSFRGLLVLTGIAEGTTENPHLIRSADGKAALWAGTIDDLWQFGKPTGKGSPWLDTPVVPGSTSDPYLIAGYGTLHITTRADTPVTLDAEIDPTGDGIWLPWRSFHTGTPDASATGTPDARWIRFRSNGKATATVTVESR